MLRDYPWKCASDRFCAVDTKTISQWHAGGTTTPQLPSIRGITRVVTNTGTSEDLLPPAFHSLNDTTRADRRRRTPVARGRREPPFARPVSMRAEDLLGSVVDLLVDVERQRKRRTGSHPLR